MPPCEACEGMTEKTVSPRRVQGQTAVIRNPLHQSPTVLNSKGLPHAGKGTLPAEPLQGLRGMTHTMQVLIHGFDTSEQIITRCYPLRPVILAWGITPAFRPWPSRA